MASATTFGAALLLERGEQLSVFDDRLVALKATRRGRLLLVAGEAGIGKTTLVRAFCERARGVRVLSGGCDALHTPRVLGPFVDIAEESGGELAALVSRGATPGAVVGALIRELRDRPTIIVLEDLHWADGATLDVLRLLARRIDPLPALVLVTYRDDELHLMHPLRMALGELPAAAVERMALAPLSLDAVALLAGPAEIDAGELHRRTSGNPFFVSEALAAGGGEVPETVRDAVLARAARLDDDARTLLEAVAIEPARVELWLLEALLEGEPVGLEACLASGMLRAERNTVGFRHEIARVVVEEALSPHRRVQLSRRALGALTAAIGRRPDPARLAHHAEAADDALAVLRYAPAAAERACRLGSHREAAEQFARAVRHARGLPAARRAELLERWSYECYLVERISDAIDARRAAMEAYRRAGDRRREGDAHRWLSRLAWFAGDGEKADEEARLSVDLLVPLGPGRELAMAYSNFSQLRMLTSDEPGAIEWGMHAITLAEPLGETEILAHALNNVGTSELKMGMPSGLARLERSLALSLQHDLEEHVARAYTNIASTSLDLADYARADEHLAAGIAYCRDRDLDSWLFYMTGHQARSHLNQGRWNAAAVSALEVLADPREGRPTRVWPLIVIGVLRARRGDSDPWSALDEALELAQGIGELQRLSPVAAARAEAHWLAGQTDAVEAETSHALALAVERRDACAAGELYLWRRRAGIEETFAPRVVSEPYRLELEGEFEAAAALWCELGCPYEAALALAHTDCEEAQRDALGELQRLGARPATTRVARALRERGARDVRQGPRATTRENPAGLTARELEVVALIAEGLRNAEIAARLFMSERTVAHHVSAILRKLEVSTRGQASAEAARRGIVQR
jgi:DNA-binding CsgD family transcriptional regulator/tetratricopeptide (TPR) repeat protein